MGFPRNEQPLPSLRSHLLPPALGKRCSQFKFTNRVHFPAESSKTGRSVGLRKLTRNSSYSRRPNMDRWFAASRRHPGPDEVTLALYGRIRFKSIQHACHFLIQVGIHAQTLVRRFAD